MSAVASSRAAESATTSRSFRLRAGSTRWMLALAWMPLARPRGEHQEDARVARRAQLVGLLRVEVGHEATAAGHGAAVLLDLDLTAHHDHPGTLVDLVLLEPLASRQVDRDHARLGIGPEDLRLVRLDVERRNVPGLHARESTQRLARP